MSKEALKISGMPSATVTSLSVPATSCTSASDLDHAGACDQKQRPVDPDLEAGQFHAPAAAGSCEPR